jgi:hypothetical protein
MKTTQKNERFMYISRQGGEEEEQGEEKVVEEEHAEV